MRSRSYARRWVSKRASLEFWATTSVIPGRSRFYIGEVTGGDIVAFGPETEEMRLTTYQEATALLNRARYKQVLDDVFGERTASGCSLVRRSSTTTVP
jgi:hypothetical protein